MSDDEQDSLYRMNIHSGAHDERDETPVMITRGMLKQLLRYSFMTASRNRFTNVRIPDIDEGSIIVGAMLHPDDDAISIELADGRELECEVWPDELE